MKKFLWVMVLMVFVSIACLPPRVENLPNSPNNPYYYSFSNGVGILTLKNISLDNAWGMVIQTLMEDRNTRIINTDKQGRLIEAERRPELSWNYNLQLYFEEANGAVNITARVAPLRGYGDNPDALLLGRKSMDNEYHFYEKKFFDELIKKYMEKK